jgi:hypothetical protein
MGVSWVNTIFVVHALVQWIEHGAKRPMGDDLRSTRCFGQPFSVPKVIGVRMGNQHRFDSSDWDFRLCQTFQQR